MEKEKEKNQYHLSHEEMDSLEEATFLEGYFLKSNKAT